jgi:catechol 2,3-dioxygenase-like lactoylglutathione lyase family enzyme
MADRATPNLPSRDFLATSRFYQALGFEESFRDRGWMILRRGEIQLEFFPFRELDPFQNNFGCCLRVDDADALHAAFSAAGLPTDDRSIPRLSAPVDQPWGFRFFALVDADGNLLRCLAPLGR